MNLKIISAGAGSGKTYRLTREMVDLLQTNEVRASGIIATTFTKKAAAELQERVRVTLLEKGLSEAANDLTNALIGTVHGLGVKLLKRFAFEAGVSPQVDIIAEEDQQVMFNQSLSMVLTNDRVEEMEYLANRLGFNKSEYGGMDWRRLLNQVTDVARANDFSPEILDLSRVCSFETFCSFLDEESDRSQEEWNEMLERELAEAITRLENNSDTTKTTADGIKILKEIQVELGRRQELFWYQWMKISKVKIGAKSRDDLAPLADFTNSHLSNAAFRKDIQSFIFNIFDLAQAAIDEFGRFKKSRGLIDYTDMEVLVKRLLDDPQVQDVLSKELDLLMVDEFQDTSPVQLEIFLKLSRFARHSVWVGDPKQSIYGFRGAEPALMQAIVKSQGGMQDKNILACSWRSREDIVFLTNAIFTRAFDHMPPNEVTLKPKRCKLANGKNTSNQTDEPQEMGNSLHHWHFKYDGEGRKPGKEWFNHCLANALQTNLQRGMLILPKGEKNYRLAKPGDVAILCRSNKECKDMAEALHRAGLRAAISRAGLSGTAEARLILACLKFILNKYDSLSIAEILLLAGQLQLEEIIEDRLVYLDKKESETLDYKWGEQNSFIQQLNKLRPEVAELSGTEILTLLLDELELRRIIVSWGNVEQRLANVDVLSSLGRKYEEACNRLHSAPSLGGFLLWLNDLENDGADLQGSGENPAAVNVITYHKSKGLEYPVVICHSLENTLREDVWGLSIVSTQEVDLDNLLGNRWLRLWVNPYSDQYRGTELASRIDKSQEKEIKRTEALAEEARLLYVGITRARDYLVFPTREKPPVWLNRVCGKGNEDFPALDPNNSESNWEWEGMPLETDLEVFHFPNDFAYAHLQEDLIYFQEKRAGKVTYPPYVMSTQDASNGNGVHLVQESSYASALPLPETPERQLAGKAFRSFLLSDRSEMNEMEKSQMAKALMERHDTSGLLEPAIFVEQSRAFSQWLNNQLKIKILHRNYPLRIHQEGRLFQTNIDFLAETDAGLVAIFQTPFVGDNRARHKKLKELGGVVGTSKSALQKIRGVVTVRTFVHFVLYGILAEVNSD